MRPPAKIKNWLDTEQMLQWLQEAPDQAAYKRRTAIWLTHVNRLHASKVAEILDVSTQAVWLWINQYNKAGPSGLMRKGRGGRRWGFMSFDEEAKLLEPFIRKARSGNPPKAKVIKSVIEKHLNRKVSISYVYRLLRRHGWAEIIAQSRLAKIRADYQDTFEKLSKPWQRTT